MGMGGGHLFQGCLARLMQWWWCVTLPGCWPLQTVGLASSVLQCQCTSGRLSGQPRSYCPGFSRASQTAAQSSAGEPASPDCVNLSPVLLSSLVSAVGHGEPASPDCVNLSPVLLSSLVSAVGHGEPASPDCVNLSPVLLSSLVSAVGHGEPASPDCVNLSPVLLSSLVSAVGHGERPADQNTYLPRVCVLRHHGCRGETPDCWPWEWQHLEHPLVWAGKCSGRFVAMLPALMKDHPDEEPPQ